MQLRNYVDGIWTASSSSEGLPVDNPATAEILATVPVGSGEDVGAAVDAASRAFTEWRRVPPTERISYNRRVTHAENLFLMPNWTRTVPR